MAHDGEQVRKNVVFVIGAGVCLAPVHCEIKYQKPHSSHTFVAYGAGISLRARYAMPGTHVAYDALPFTASELHDAAVYAC
eukprot:3281182-Rhodomonas_salina.1